MRVMGALDGCTSTVGMTKLVCGGFRVCGAGMQRLQQTHQLDGSAAELDALVHSDPLPLPSLLHRFLALHLTHSVRGLFIHIR